MDCTPLAELTEINLEDVYRAFGIERSGRLRAAARRIFWSAAQRFARLALEYDQGVAELGLSGGGRHILGRLHWKLEVFGQEHLPRSGPVLILSNHPGLGDTVALFASFPRADIQIVAAERPFLKALPATSRHLIPIGENGQASIQSMRAIAAQLRAGGGVLTFPAGQIEPDPACMPGARESLERWSDSTRFFARLAPDLCIAPVIVSGVIAPQSLRHPLTRLRRNPRDREQLAAALQLIVATRNPARWPLTIRVRYGPAMPAAAVAEPGGLVRLGQQLAALLPG